MNFMIQPLNGWRNIAQKAPFSINRFQPFLVLGKWDDTEEGAFTRILQGLFDYGFHWIGIECELDESSYCDTSFCA